MTVSCVCLGTAETGESGHESCQAEGMDVAVGHSFAHRPLLLAELVMLDVEFLHSGSPDYLVCRDSVHV